MYYDNNLTSSKTRYFHLFCLNALWSCTTMLYEVIQMWNVFGFVQPCIKTNNLGHHPYKKVLIIKFLQFFSVFFPCVNQNKLVSWKQGTTSWIHTPSSTSLTLVPRSDEGPNYRIDMPSEPVMLWSALSCLDPSHLQEFHSACDHASLQASPSQCVGILVICVSTKMEPEFVPANINKSCKSHQTVATKV